MTQKELAYVEDAIGHEDIMIKVISESTNYLEDDALITFMGKELKKHVNTKQELMTLLEDKSNEWWTNIK